MNRKLNIEELTMVTGGGDLFMKHYYQEQIDKRKKAAEEEAERNARSKTGGACGEW